MENRTMVQHNGNTYNSDNSQTWMWGSSECVSVYVLELGQMDETIWGKWNLPSMWRDVRRIGEAECVQNVKVDIFHWRDWWAEVSSDAYNICTSFTISQRLAKAFQTNAEVATPVPEYLKEFTLVFSKQTFNILLEPKEWDHAVELIPGYKPSGCKIYPLLLAEQKELDAFLKENLETGQIWPSKSPMSSPVFFIEKKDGSLWLVQDYQALNAVTIKNKYPLLLISKLINKLQGAQYFPRLNVCWGFNNVWMKDRDEWKAAFRTNRGLYELLIMFFRLMNSPATFQTMMDRIFEDLISEGRVMKQKLHYLVKWEGYGIKHNSWEPADDIHTLECVADFHWKHPRAPDHIWFADFDTIPFQTISSAVPGHHSLEGGWM